MKSTDLIHVVLAAPGKTACELAKITGVRVDSLSGALNRLVKAKRLQRFWRPGQRRCAHAWRYWPIYSVAQQEDVLSALHDLMKAQSKNPRTWRCVTGGYSYHPDSVRVALHTVMKIFGRGVAVID